MGNSVNYWLTIFSLSPIPFYYNSEYWTGSMVYSTRKWSSSVLTQHVASTDEYPLYTIHGPRPDTIAHEIVVDDKPLSMEVNTGAWLSIINHDIFVKHWLNKKHLHNVHPRISYRPTLVRSSRSRELLMWWCRTGMGLHISYLRWWFLEPSPACLVVTGSQKSLLTGQLLTLKCLRS